LFIVDAGSKDETLKIAQESGVEIFSEPRCTRGRARNICIQRAKSEIIAIVDSDVVIPPGWLSAVETHFQDPTVSEVASPYYTLEPRSGGLVSRVIYYMTSGWQAHLKPALKRENWVSQ